MALAGGVCLIFQDKFADNVPLIALFVLFAKFGMSMATCINHIATPWLFPTVVCGTAFGLCNLLGRFSGIGAPIVAELEIPLPMEIFSALAGVSIFTAFFINPKQNG